MSTDPRAGQPATAADLVDVAALVTAYYTGHPDVTEPAQQVAFGTSGHRGSSLDLAFNEDHIAATSQAICEYRAARRASPARCSSARDTHALSEPAWATALEVFAANDVTVLVDDRDRYTPTPAVSHAILRHNRDRAGRTSLAPTVSWSPRRTTRRATAASSTTRRTAAPPAATSPAGSRTGPTRSCAAG